MESVRKQAAGERLYNGIVLPEQWPPAHMGDYGFDPLPVPYLESVPETIDISVGRQLFVDDFLIEKTDLTREYHQAKDHPANPLLMPESPAETGVITNTDLPTAAPFHGGVWYSGEEELFRLWYKAGFFGSVALATSKDGIRWERPELDVVPGSNLVIEVKESWQQDSNAVIFDPDTSNEAERYKMFIYNIVDNKGYVFVSPDGIHWSDPIPTGTVGDCSTIFYNPFRKKWVYSVRDYWYKRSRRYFECDDFLAGAGFPEAALWLRADRLDQPEEEIGDEPELYNFNAVAYESILLGGFNIYYGIHKDPVYGDVKYNDIHLGYSRDGFHFYRPEDRTPFLRASRTPGNWKRGYLHDAASLCLVNGDELWFYYAGFQGNGRQGWLDMHSHAGTGLAVLRRDGFASLNAGKEPGALTTRPLVFRGSRLFVNLDAPAGALKAEILAEDGTPLEGFRLEDCRPVTGDSTKAPVSWNGQSDLSSLAGKRLRFRFWLQNGKLYSFWVSPDETGASNGYLAGGSVGQIGLKDTPESYRR